MHIINLFIRDFTNFFLFINLLLQILNLLKYCIWGILNIQYHIYVNGGHLFIAIISGIFLNWKYCLIYSLILIIKMYSFKCYDIYEMYNYEKQKNVIYEDNIDIVSFEIYQLKHKIKQVNVNCEIKIKLIMYEYDLSLCQMYDIMLDKNYILNHKYNQLIINKYIEKNTSKLHSHTHNGHDKTDQL
jgi:hypothetical protein